MNFLKLRPEKLDLNEINDLVVHESCGGVSFFVGTTRDNFGDKEVATLEYEAYDKMALKAMEEICDKMRSRWPDIKHIAIYHRLGVVPVKEASVIIGVSSPHRLTSLEAVHMAIDLLKEKVPIWKKEMYKDSEEPTVRQRRIRAVSHLNFDDCTVQAAAVPSNLVQIHADELEINRRVNCFVERKRDEINENNVLDFIEPLSTTDEEDMTCARIRSTVYRTKDLRTHFRVHRVKNEYGPQSVKQTYTNALDKLMELRSPQKIKQEYPPLVVSAGITERLTNAESHLHLSATSTSVYDRLKAIENRILYLETVSPEYNHFMPKVPTRPKVAKKTHSLDDIDGFMKSIQSKFKS